MSSDKAAAVGIARERDRANRRGSNLIGRPISRIKYIISFTSVSPLSKSLARISRGTLPGLALVMEVRSGVAAMFSKESVKRPSFSASALSASPYHTEDEIREGKKKRKKKGRFRRRRREIADLVDVARRRWCRVQKEKQSGMVEWEAGRGWARRTGRKEGAEKKKKKRRTTARTIEKKGEGGGLFPGGSKHRLLVSFSLSLFRRFVFTMAKPVCIRGEQRGPVETGGMGRERVRV